MNRKKFRFVGISLIISLLANFYFLFGQKYFQKQENLVAVSAIVDGDTFDDGQGNRYRLLGINAPEYPQGCLAQSAKDRLEELILGKTLRTEIMGEDHFGRDLVFVFLGEVFVNKVLLQEGLAKTEGDDYQYSEELNQAQAQAKTLKKGVWSLECLPPKGCNIKGNVRKENGTFIYHLPGCNNYERIVMNENEGDAWFCTEKEAKAAGFTKSLDCP
ncbi:MAG: thermonuclease family protein [Candidatus Shapirobacteria bacterium]